MTRFADQLFDDLMRDHGSTLAHTRVQAAPKRHPVMRPVLLTAGAGGLAAAATVGSLVATGGGTPAYAVTTNSDGTVTLAVYQESGIAGANAQLRRLGDDRVVVVPVESGCPSLFSLPAPRVPAREVTVQGSGPGIGTITVGEVPAGDILLVLNIENTGTQRVTEAMLTSGKAPSCVSIPSLPTPHPNG
ncbi:MAG TPA: hypothetical protein VGD84_03185 [Pseudonocardiaceae bacterium]